MPYRPQRPSRPIYREPYRSVATSVAGSGGGGPDPVITVQPSNAVVSVGDDAVFTVTAEGTEPITYQWWEYKV